MRLTPTWVVILFGLLACGDVNAHLPTLLDSGVIFSYPKSNPYDRTNQYGFNHAPSVTMLSDSRLLAAWFSGPFEASVDQVVLGSYSADGGKTWGDAFVLNDQPHKSDFDPAFIADGKRTWFFCSVGRWNRYPVVGGRDVEKSEVGLDSFKTFYRYTDDAGKTWSADQRAGDFTGSGPRSNGIKLASGELLLPLHQYMGQQISVLKSGDGGATWRRILCPKPDPSATAAEPCVAECSSGNLLMIMRTKDGMLWTARSTDKGQTWSPMKRTNMPAAASSASVISLADGRLALIHNPSKPPLRTPLTICLSSDEGQTWDEPLELAKVDVPHEHDSVFSAQVAYPSAIQLPDGDVFVVWTQISMSADSQSGQIHWARVRVK